MAPKLTELHPRLFIRGHTKGILSTTMLDVCREKQIGFILNVALIPDDFLHSACRTIGIRYKHEPLHDSKDGIAENVPQLIEEVQRSIDAGVLVHCDSGYNRSALIAIPALVCYSGRSAREIIDEVRKERPRVLHNTVFEQYVLNYVPARKYSSDWYWLDRN